MSLCINPTCPQPHQSNHKNRFCESCGSELQLLGRYQVVSLLSDENGFSKVYQGYGRDTPKIIKVLHHSLSLDAPAVELFSEEASLLARLNHPDILNFEEYFQYKCRNGTVLHCIVMTMNDEEQLSRWLVSHNNLVSPLQYLDRLKELTRPPIKKNPFAPILAALLVSLGLLALTLWVTVYSPVHNLKVSQSPKDKGDINYFTYAEGVDSQGNTAMFSIAVLSVKYQWLNNSDFQVQDGDEVISLEVLGLKLNQGGIQQIMDYPQEIIAVGTANCGDNPTTQEQLALQRSQQVKILAHSLFRNVASVKAYRLLNLGQFQGVDCQSNHNPTKYQNSLLIIGMQTQAKDVIVDEALRDRLENKPFADFKLQDYSLASVTGFKTIIADY